MDAPALPSPSPAARAARQAAVSRPLARIYVARMAVRPDLTDDQWLVTVPALFGGRQRLSDARGFRRSLEPQECRAVDTGAVLTSHRAA